MAHTFLTVPFKDKDAAKGLGARWDAAQRQWFVPEGRELAPFALWLPSGSVPASNSDVLSMLDDPAALAMPVKKGVSLSSLLAGVSRAVAQAYQAGVWTLVEVVELRANGGHVYLEVSERDAHGAVLAKAQYGFSLDIDAIDQAYTLGELEARKQGIRAQLQAEGVFAANKQLPPPWDFQVVLVVAPTGGAGLGDFQAEADRLQSHGICRFTYALSRFQGEGAPAEMRHALQVALGQGTAIGATPFDAVVIIRGGGAVNDLAWLNDYGLARLICDLPIPVFTGIGHERDNTVLDEVAHTRYDTPSKVIAGIEQRIAQRVGEVKANFAQVYALAARASQAAKDQAGKFEMTVRLEALRHLVLGRQGASGHLAAIRVDAMQGVRKAAEQSRDAFQTVKTQVAAQLADARGDVPALWSQIALGSAHALRTAAAENAALKDGILERARQQALHATQASRDALDSVSDSAKRLVHSAATDSQALLREITWQGPEKTLQRGFAIVRNQSGEPLTRVLQAMDGAAIEIEFQDGRVAATIQKHL